MLTGREDDDALAPQIIDQHVSGIAERQADVFTNELGLGADDHRRRSVAFPFLVAKTAFDLTDEQVLDGIVDGGADFGVFTDELNGAQAIRIDRSADAGCLRRPQPRAGSLV